MAAASKIQKSLDASYYRGGTSRALFFRQEDLPATRDDWKGIFRGTLGSPDPNGRELDGLGGGISSLSKICVVGLSTRPDVDVDFTFAQVGVKDGKVGYSSNCGNMTSAVGPFAVDAGVVDIDRVCTGTQATVRIFNTNTNKMIHSNFAVNGGEATASGLFAIDGVAGTGSPIELSFIDPAGSRTGALLPTGSLSDILDGVQTTCIDVANPCVFVKATSLNVDGTVLPQDIKSHPNLLLRLERIRQQAAVKMGLCKFTEAAATDVPKIGLVAPSLSHVILGGETMEETSADLLVRIVSMGEPHLATPITVALAVAAAARLPGSVIAECASCGTVTREKITIGHPSGRIVVGSSYDENGQLKAATVYRTARRLMEGKVFWK